MNFGIIMSKMSVKDEQGRPMFNADGKAVLDDLLHNRNGLFYCKLGDQVELFFVDINDETGQKKVRNLTEPQNITQQDQKELEQFKRYIHDNIAMNSSLRTSDEQHALIQRLFGIKLERNGIHYELNGEHYQDTYDGCVRLINGYRRYMEVFRSEPETHIPSNACHNAYMNFVGMGQRRGMVHVLQRFCELDQPFSPLQNKDDLKNRHFIRSIEYNTWHGNNSSVYPLRLNYGIGCKHSLMKSTFHIPGVVYAIRPDRFQNELASVRMIEEVRKDCFQEQLLELEQRIHPSPCVLSASPSTTKK